MLSTYILIYLFLKQDFSHAADGSRAIDHKTQIIFTKFQFNMILWDLIDMWRRRGVKLLFLINDDPI